MAHTKFTLIKTVSQLEKMQAFTVPPSTVLRSKKIYLHINESTNLGIKWKMKFGKSNLRRQLSSANSEDVLVYLEIKSTHSFKSIPKQLGIKEDSKATNKMIPTLRERQSWIRKMWGSKSFPLPWFCSPYENHWQSENFSRSSKRSRIEVLTSNRQ